ncbi:hypothetical protein BSL78_28602 [Apostichopus japonicus]|uniref:Integrase p58-like C-terminal domain-containing protein n=1 Tax=Stichopus japonicus TaxID=307972 RepID=A0A2G8JFS7_STIJA|nr:hypothetical protein BSL78_28602 [Apostichopus japonicus]
MLGRETTLPLELMIGQPVSTVVASTTSEYVMTFAQRCEKAFRIARDHNTLGQKRQKRYYDARIGKVASSYSVQDKVWVAVHAKKKGRSPKLQLRWNGPFVITHKLSDCLYRIRHIDSAKLKVVHVDRLKKYVTPDELNQMTVTPEHTTVEPATEIAPDKHITDMGHEEVLEEELEDVVETEGERPPELLKRKRRPPVWMQDYERY